MSSQFGELHTSDDDPLPLQNASGFDDSIENDGGVLVDGELRFKVKRIFNKLEAFDIASDLKLHLRNHFESVLTQTDNLDVLEKMLSDFDAFMRKRNDKLAERDNYLSCKVGGISLWGGPLISVYGKCIPGESGAEVLEWSREIMASAVKGEISLVNAEHKMNERLKAIKKDRDNRVAQVKSFLDLRGLFKGKKVGPSLAQRLSVARFSKATYSAREGIILRLSAILKEDEIAKEWAKSEQEKFEDYLKNANNLARVSPPEKALEIYDSMKMKLRGSGFESEVFYTEWMVSIKHSELKRESEIRDWALKARRELSECAGQKKLFPLQKKNFQNYLDKFANVPPKLMLKGGLNNLLIRTELMLLERLDSDLEENDDAEEEPILTRYSIFAAQEENEWLRRFLQSVAALCMSMGKDTSTANASQVELVHEGRVTQDTFNDRRREHLENIAVDKVGNNLEDLDVASTGDIDTISAVEKEDDSLEVDLVDEGLEVAVSEKKQKEHKTSYWDMLRISGVKPWPVGANERYLLGVLQSKRHLTLTDNYMVVSSVKAKSLLRHRLIKSLAHLPGKTVAAKHTSLRVLSGLISEATHSSTDFVRNIFSYTKGRAMKTKKRA